MPGLEADAVGRIEIQGMPRPVEFVVRGGSPESASLEVKLDGAVRAQYLTWLSGVTGSQAAA